jgi:cytochrome bd ubiquinol oxidase subunit II
MTILQSCVLLFLGAALLLYVLLGGADFGAGILEIFLGRERREDEVKVISHAVAPVWEANHVWLILAVVILFVGYPLIYTSISVYLHIPLLAVLVGIVARGCAFTFRHYDTLNRNLYSLYSKIFAGSSLWTSFFLGVVAGASILGKIDPNAPDFFGLYLSPWLNSFCLMMGIFTLCLFAFLAAVYLTGEAKERDLQILFKRKALFAAFGMVISGMLVFLCAHFDQFPLTGKFFGNSLSVVAFVLATLLWLPFWSALNKNPRTWQSRLLGGIIVTLVMFGWFSVQYPVAIRFSGKELTFIEAAAPEATLRSLLIALIVGSLLIFPALAYLFKVFKWETFEITK